MLRKVQQGPDRTAGVPRTGSPEDLRLFEVLQQLVEYRGRMRGATALGVNYRTVAKNLEAGSLSRRVRRALQEFEAGLEPAESPDLDGSRGSGGRTQTVAQQMETLAGEVGHLTEMVEAQGRQLQELGRRVAGLEDVAGERTAGNVGPAVDEGVSGEWRPPAREQGMPDAGLVTREPQPDEEHAFGPAVASVAKWRDLRAILPNRRGVDRARAGERWWELGVILMDRYHLTLPPNTERLRGSEREDYLRRLRERLAQVRGQRVTAQRWETLRRVVTLGLWRGWMTREDGLDGHTDSRAPHLRHHTGVVVPYPGQLGASHAIGPVHACRPLGSFRASGAWRVHRAAALPHRSFPTAPLPCGCLRTASAPCAPVPWCVASPLLATGLTSPVPGAPSATCSAPQGRGAGSRRHWTSSPPPFKKPQKWVVCVLFHGFTGGILLRKTYNRTPPDRTCSKLEKP